MEEIRRVQVADILRARDTRQSRQQALLARYRAPVISFTLNIAGDIKYDAAIHRAFAEGCRRIRTVLSRCSWEISTHEETVAFTGCEALWAVRADAQSLKDRMIAVEEADALGRLFDIDVIDPSGRHLSRGSERPCLICGAPVKACARSRAHAADALYRKAQEIIRAHFAQQHRSFLGEIAQRALLYEALTTPKPGLVDCENTGAHIDMDLFSFAGSACTLRPYFEKCAQLGAENAPLAQLQLAGIWAEDAMFSAVHTNTHKGAIFSLGILCYAAGACGEDAGPETILSAAAHAGRYFLGQMQANPRALTGGEQQFRSLGLTGARGEAASGFASVRTHALPALKSALAQGLPLQKAGLHALMSLISSVQDSNIIRRAGTEGQYFAAETARSALESGCREDDLRKMNDVFVRRNISPGGSADLLAVTYFLHFLEAKER